jgi:hypothetical protein
MRVLADGVASDRNRGATLRLLASFGILQGYSMLRFDFAQQTQMQKVSAALPSVERMLARLADAFAVLQAARLGAAADVRCLFVRRSVFAREYIVKVTVCVCARIMLFAKLGTLRSCQRCRRRPRRRLSRRRVRRSTSVR